MAVLVAALYLFDDCSVGRISRIEIDAEMLGGVIPLEGRDRSLAKRRDRLGDRALNGSLHSRGKVAGNRHHFTGGFGSKPISQQAGNSWDYTLCVGFILEGALPLAHERNSVHEAACHRLLLGPL